jgi:glycosyltransferase involved in cell wall biosynthesis
MPLPTVTTIIPTLCAPERGATLLRAIDSLLGQRDVAVLPLVVVNGNRFDPALVEILRRRTDIRVHTIGEGRVTAAQRAGREQVQSEFFSFLDDDDEYLSGALSARLAPLEADPSVDVVVSNGYRMTGGRKTACLDDVARVAADPLRGLVDANWLPSCGGLFRTARVGPEFFDAPLAHHEWTHLAFRLALGRRLAFIADMTYLIHDTPGSASKSADHELATAAVLDAVLRLDLDAATRRLVRRNYGRALHVRAEHALGAGEIGKAWSYHVASLRQPGGLGSFGLYTRKLLWSALAGVGRPAQTTKLRQR